MPTAPDDDNGYLRGMRTVLDLTMTCDVGQAVSFNPAEHHAFGYVNSLAIGNINVPADLNATDLVTAVPARPVAAVLSGFRWDTTASGPITFQCRVSPANARTIALRALHRPARIEVGVAFTAYDYDPARSRYFPKVRTHVAAAADDCSAITRPMFPSLYGVVPAKTGTTGLSVNLRPVEDPPGFRGCSLTLVLAPEPAKPPQHIQVQTSAATTLVRSFGRPDT